MIQEVIDSLVSVEGSDQSLRARFRFAPDLRVFEGHFPGYPLVPAVYLLAAVRVAVERHLDRALRIDEVIDSKFKAELRPGQDLDVEVEIGGQDRSLECKASLAARHGVVTTAHLRLVERR